MCRSSANDLAKTTMISILWPFGSPKDILSNTRLRDAKIGRWAGNFSVIQLRFWTKSPHPIADRRVRGVICWVPELNMHMFYSFNVELTAHNIPELLKLIDKYDVRVFLLVTTAIQITFIVIYYNRNRYFSRNFAWLINFFLTGTRKIIEFQSNMHIFGSESELVRYTMQIRIKNTFAIFSSFG